MNKRLANDSRDHGVVHGSTQGARRDALIYLPAYIVPSVVSALTTIVFTRLFSPAAWGNYAMALAVAQVAIIAQSSWLERSTIRFLSAEKAAGGPPAFVEEESSAAPVPSNPALLPLRLTALNAAVFFLLALVTFAAISVLRPGNSAMAFAIMLFGTTSIAATGLSSIQKACLRPWSSTWATMVGSVCGFLCTLVVVQFLGSDPAFLILGPAVGLGIATTLLARDTMSDTLDISWRALPHALRKDRSPGALSAPSSARTYLKYGLPLAVFYLAGWLLSVSDRLIIGWTRGATEAGIYSPNYTLAALVIGMVAVPISSAATPRILGLSTTASESAIQQTVKRTSRDYLLIGVPIFVWLAVSSRDIAAVLLGADFRAGSSVIPLVAGGTLLWSLGMYGHKGLEIKERSLTMLAIAGACCVVNVSLNLVFVPHFGYIAAGWSTLVSYGLYPILAYFVALRVLPWRMPWRAVLWLSVGGVLGAVAVRLTVYQIVAIGPLARAAASGLMVVGITGLVLLAAREISLGTIRTLWARPNSV